MFAIPYEDDFTLIGTTDRDYPRRPGTTSKISEAEVDYLCKAASEYFARAGADATTSSGPIPPCARSLTTAPSKAQEATRDYVLKVDEAPGTEAPGARCSTSSAAS